MEVVKIISHFVVYSYFHLLVKFIFCDKMPLQSIGDTRMTLHEWAYNMECIERAFGEFKISFEMSASLRVVLSYDFKRRIVDIYMYS